MNEFDFIKSLRAQAETRKHSARVITGIGDDASVISERAHRDLLVTTDLLIEGVDFYRAATPPRLLGHKALAVSLSDIAAMGGRPLCALISFGMTRDLWNSNFKAEVFEGIFALADRFGVTVAGGDVSETKDGAVIDSIVLGEVDSGAAVTRAGAQPGDQIYVTGSLGGAAAGLKLIENGARLSEPPALAGGPDDDAIQSLLLRQLSLEQRSEVRGQRSEEDENRLLANGLRNSAGNDAIQSLILRQLRPEPRVGWGIVLGEERLATAMIDISDGLSSDLAHLCEESNVAATIEAAAIPLDRDVQQLCGRRALDPLALALSGGEDFELLFTVHPKDVARLPKRVDGISVARIGEVTDASGKILIREKNREWDLSPRGFQHFSS